MGERYRKWWEHTLLIGYFYPGLLVWILVFAAAVGFGRWMA